MSGDIASRFACSCAQAGGGDLLILIWQIFVERRYKASINPKILFCLLTASFLCAFVAPMSFA